MKTIKSLIAVLLFTLQPSALNGQLLDKKTLTLEVAERVAAAAEAEAKRRNATLEIVVVDDGGYPLVLKRLNDTQVASVEVGIGKARTAAIFRRRSAVFEEQIRTGRVATFVLPGATPLQGGLPLTYEGKVVGAIGVSGNTPQEDEAIALAGAKAFAADVQRIADKFSTYYLPVVTGMAALTWLIRRDPLAMAAVLVVACSCSFALATPIAMLASIGAGARRGLLIKGGKYLEALARADVLLIDKTGTLTLGRPQITDVVSLNGASEEEILSLVASTERYSEHPLAEAVRSAAGQRQLPVREPEDFEALPGLGVRARLNGHVVQVGNRRMIPAAASLPILGRGEDRGYCGSLEKRQ